MPNGQRKHIIIEISKENCTKQTQQYGTTKLYKTNAAIWYNKTVQNKRSSMVQQNCTKQTQQYGTTKLYKTNAAIWYNKTVQNKRSNMVQQNLQRKTASAKLYIRGASRWFYYRIKA